MNQKRRLWGDLIADFQHLKESYKKYGDRCFRPVAVGQRVIVLN